MRAYRGKTRRLGMGILVVMACAAAACSAKAPRGLPAEGPKGTSTSAAGNGSLTAALTRIGDTTGNRGEVYYSHTAPLARITGGNDTRGFAQLKFYGAEPLVNDSNPDLTADTGIDLSTETYAITAGNDPLTTLMVIDGGQDGKLVTDRLTRIGWKPSGGELVHGPQMDLSEPAPLEQQTTARVKASGSDIIAGGFNANLAQAGSPAGATLASDPMMSALAGCLGDVTAARFMSDTNPEAPVTELAFGVTQPSSSTATPHAVACTVSPTSAAAARYAAAARTALTSGTSTQSGRRYSTMLKNPKVTIAGGAQHVVRWQADTPGDPFLIFNMIEENDIPGLAD